MPDSKARKLSGCIDVFYLPPARRGTTSLVSHASDRCRETVDTVVRLMDQSGIEQVFITPCKLWSCDRSLHCDLTELGDVLRFTASHPKRFVGIAGYNPFDISETLRAAEAGIQQHGFRGVYVHPSRFGLSPTDRRMYPLYSKCSEWTAPVIVDLRALPHESPSDKSRTIERILDDFPELTCVVAHTEWTTEQMLTLAGEFPYLFFSFDTASLLFPEVQNFLQQSLGQQRAMWGSNGVPWKAALSELARCGISGRDSLLRHNARRVFQLNKVPNRRPKAYTSASSPEPIPIAE